ncbi:hypothetical protein CEXT_40871 [Caerostris extrusa]|uniref:Uncharacterized protein n=1 Tax=Caerostris extrusa TaxID=172846 RepID=A0AAV4MTQ2_CAEEX|nr:hypothetical protein CEXT_40871 [Caerostris extrusa]
MEAAKDEWWRRMERDATIDYTVQESAPGASNPELMDKTCAAMQSERLTSPTFPEKQSNLSDERTQCTHIYCDQEEGPCTESLRCTCCSADCIFSR